MNKNIMLPVSETVTSPEISLPLDFIRRWRYDCSKRNKQKVSKPYDQSGFF